MNLLILDSIHKFSDHFNFLHRIQFLGTGQEVAQKWTLFGNLTVQLLRSNVVLLVMVVRWHQHYCWSPSIHEKDLLKVFMQCTVV